MLKIRFIPECHADTALMRFFVSERNLIDHQHCIGDVSNAMKNIPDKSYTLIGLVDKDKRQPRYFDDFQEIRTSKYLVFKKKPDLEQYLIILCPAIEKFIIALAQEFSIDIKRFDLPDDFDTLKKTTKRVGFENHQGFQNLLQHLKENGSETLQEIAYFISQFKSSIPDSPS